MNDSAAVTLQQFLREVRKRLWLACLLDNGSKIAWYTCVVLLLLGAVHRFVFPLSAALVICVAIVPALLLLARVLWQRPTMENCAARADREFHGQALMTTALECMTNSGHDDTFASRTVLLQADKAARRWLPEVSTRFRGPPARATILATIPLFVALVLLGLPGANNQLSVVGPTTGVTNSSSGAESGSLDRPGDDVEKLRGILADEAQSARPVDPTVQESASSVATTTEQVDDPEATVQRADASDSLDLDQMQAGVAGIRGPDGDLPGDAIARSTPQTDAISPAARFRTREEISLLRTGTKVSASANSISAYSAFNLWENNLHGNVLPAASPDTLTQWTILSRSQAEHARRYLGNSGNNND
jgi:hypothetical protein